MAARRGLHPGGAARRARDERGARRPRAPPRDERQMPARQGADRHRRRRHARHRQEPGGHHAARRRLRGRATSASTSRVDDFSRRSRLPAGRAGLSALLTTTMMEMREVIDALDARGLGTGCKVIVGGAPVSAQFAQPDRRRRLRRGRGLERRSRAPAAERLIMDAPKRARGARGLPDHGARAGAAASGAAARGGALSRAEPAPHAAEDAGAGAGPG